MRLFLFIVLFTCNYLFAGDTIGFKGAKPKILYGTASYYSNNFNGKKTANGEIY